MPFFDLELADLREYRPEIPRPDDFDEFWVRTLAETAAHPLRLDPRPLRTPLAHVEVYEVSFPGFGGHPIGAWYLRPAGIDRDLPVVVQYTGYGMGRGRPHQWLAWPAAGYATLVMDSRGQGWAAGGHSVTPDPAGSGPAAPGLLTRGLPDPGSLYHRRLFTDAVRAVAAARVLPGVDGARVAVTGASQGGALSVAAAALDGNVQAVMTDVPWLSHIRRGVGIAPAGPYAEVRQYLSANRTQVEAVFSALSYVDVAHLIERVDAPLLASVALMDTICPPSTVYATYNRYRGAERQMRVYQYNDHEGGAAFQLEEQLDWLREVLPVG